MTSLETVACDQEQWRLTAGRLKHNLERAREFVLGLSITGAVLEVLSLQFHTSYPVTSQAAGYAGAIALALMVAVRVKGLRKQQAQAWVLAAAASRSLKREMYLYRTSTGPYCDRLGSNPDATLLERRDDILERVSSIQRYAVKPEPKTGAPLGQLDADVYISERINSAMSGFQRGTDHFVSAQNFWRKLESFVAIAGALLAVALTFTHNQSYLGWVAVLTTIAGAVGSDTLAERYAQLIVEYQAMPARLTRIVGRWRANCGTLDQLVEEVEAALLQEHHAWIAGPQEFVKVAASLAGLDSSPKSGLRSPAPTARLA
jgi:hypothetical protein